MKRVAASEYTLLTIARATVGMERPAAVEPALRRNRPAPAGIGPTCAALLSDTIAVGTMRTLVRRGGWRREAFLHRGAVIEGRVWERHGTPQLTYSAFTYHVLRWMLVEPMASAMARPLEELPATLADDLICYLALDLCASLNCDLAMVREQAFRRSPLCWLAFPDRLSRPDSPPELSPQVFAPLTQGVGALIFESLQGDLTTRWAEMEWRKQNIMRNTAMTALGDGQQAVLDALLPALEAAGRQDLARFLTAAGARTLRGFPDASRWAGSLEPRGRMVERMAARHAAAAFLRGVLLLHRWAEQASAVRFFDDEYQAAQLYLSQWEPVGEEGARHASAVIRDLEALDAGVGTGA